MNAHQLQIGRSVPTWLPNAISCLRIALVPVFLVVATGCVRAVAAGEPTLAWRAGALGVLVVIGASDLADGHLARKHGLASALGATLDALADKLTQVALLIFFTLVETPAFPAVPAWFTILVFGRDLALAGGALILRQRRGAVRVVHRAHGKLTSVVVFALLLGITAGVPAGVVTGTVLVATALVALSTVGYIRDGFAQLDGGG